MYDAMMSSFKDQFAPFNTVVEINKKAAEKLMEIQSAYVTELMEATFAQFKALTGVTEPKAAFDLQVAFFKEMESKLTEVAEKELGTINAAREELTAVFEENVKSFAEQDFVKEMTKLMPVVEEAPAAKPAPRARKAPAPKAAPAEAKD